MSKYVDAIIGHAIGDAMGMPTEFCIREHLLSNPVTDMIGSKKVGQPAGTWTDDTSLTKFTNSSLDKLFICEYIATGKILINEPLPFEFSSDNPHLIGSIPFIKFLQALRHVLPTSKTSPFGV